MSKRTRTLSLLAVIILCIGALVFLSMRGNVIYYYEVQEAVTKADSQGQSRFRLAGEVVNGSVKASDGMTKFNVTDGKATVAVVHRGDPPELFTDGAPVVTEGKWQKDKQGKVFDSDRIMIRHGNEYAPPEVEQKSESTTSTSSSQP